jgi:hypothetical protein
MKTNQLFFSIQQGDQGPELTTPIGLSTLESHLTSSQALRVTMDALFTVLKEADFDH